MGKIFVEGLELPARVGVYRRERGHRQQLSLDLEASFEKVEEAAATERLADTLNYEGLVALARAVIERRHYPLVETLATTIAHSMLEQPGVLQARVRLRKIGCMPDVACAGTEVELKQESSRSKLPDTSAHRAPAPLAELPPKAGVVIVGGGVAGLATALWCGRLGHSALLLDPEPRLGGQLHLVHVKMIDLPGMAPVTGAELAARLLSRLPKAIRWFSARLAAIEVGAARVVLRLATSSGERSVAAGAVVLATGLSRRRLGVPGERELLGRGILATGSKDVDQTVGQRVVVVGGGDGACENAMKLDDLGAEVILLHRGAELSARAEFRAAVTARNIEIRLGVRIRAFIADSQQQLAAIELASGERIAAPYALLRVGWLPNSAALPDAWLNERGYVRCDAGLRVEGARRVFVAGDLRDPPAPSVAASFGDGACAAKAAISLLEREATRET
ncbi:MAG: hypothetical protein CSA65_09410 [Proteobacteria bacterium]|nr:MAG: hypothetical protein CSB49_01195 [Pseudomonadota bacterium]PIE17270.1 MAG: hypothetical protein CSA65_09410 [Pseudomonadota bacterium]